MPDQTQSAASSAPGSIPALPTLNPEDSPYKPLDLPQQQVRPPAPPEQDKPPADLGATSHAGAAAYLIDHVLKGAAHGVATGMQYAADQYNKKLSAVQSLYNDQAAQLYTIAKEGRAGTFTGPVGQDGKPTFVPSKEFTDTKGRMLVAWQAMMDTVGSRIPQPKKGKGKSGSSGGSQAAGGAGSPDTDMSAQVQSALNHKEDPAGSLASIYQIGRQIGPPVVHQITGFLTPEYVSKQSQAAQTADNASKTAVTSSGTGITNADTEAAKAQINNKLTHAVASGAPQEEIDKLLKQRDELNPSPKFPLAGEKRYTKGADGIEYEYMVDQEGNEIKDSRRPLSMAGLNPSVPKIGSFGDFMLGAYGPKPTPKQYVEGQKLFHPFAGGTTVGTHTVLVTQGDKQVPFTFTTTSTKGGGGGAGTAPDVRADGSQSSTTTPRTMVAPNPRGLVEAGNIPIDNRPTVHNADGSHSSEYSVSFADDKGREVLVPTVVGGKFLTPDGKKPPEGSPAEKTMFKAAWDHYLQTGEHLGKFDNPDNADAYASKLHSRGDAKSPNGLAHSASTPKSVSGGRAPVQSGPPIGYKDSPEYKDLVKQSIDAQKEYNGAFTNLSTMVKTAAAAKKGDGAAQVGIISGYLKTVVGGQGTGVRITKAEWDAATGTRPFLKGIEAKFSPNGYMSGAAIAPSQVDQMIREVYAKTQSLKETTKAAKQRMLEEQQNQIPDNLKPKPTNPAATSHDEEIMNLLHPKQ